MSILPLLLKVYEKEIYEQVPKYFQPFFNEFLCEFRSAYSMQYALFKLLTLWQNLLNRGGLLGSFVMDLSTAYDCLKDDLLLAKLQAYVFSKKI